MGRRPAGRGKRTGAAARRRAAFVPDRPLFDRIEALIGGIELGPLQPVEPAEPPVPAVRFAVQRARDLLVLDVEARGMRLETTGDAGPRLVVDEGQAGKARLVVGFPPQHIGEQAWLDTDPTPPRDELAAARFARFSRLAFAVPEGEEIAFSSEGVLAAMRRLALVVVPVATPRTDKRPGLADLLGHLHLPGGLVLAQSAIGPVLSTATRQVPAPAAKHEVDDLLRGSTALRALRVRLAQDFALDIRRGATDAAAAAPPPASASSSARELGLVAPPLLGAGGLVGINVIPRPRRPVQPRAPRADETAIEAPWRLILSPSALEGFTHADAPVGPADPVEALEPQTARERIELWHSRIGMRRETTRADGSKAVEIDERADRQRIVRAIWARERELFEQDPNPNDLGPFRTSLSPHDRWELVLQTAQTLTHPLGDIAPEPVDVKGLSLSALGAWLDLHGGWEAEEYAARGISAAIKSWDHLAPMGRDQFVQVVYVGFLYPLGHKAVLIKQTERKVRTATDPVARLYQRFFIVVAEPERTHGVFDLPFTRVRFLTLVTPPLAPPADQLRFWPTLPNGQDMIFTVEVVDHDGRHAKLRMPLVFLDAAEVLQPSSTVTPADAMYRPDPRAAVPAEGQRISFAPSLRPGDTSAEVRTLRLDATLEGTAGVGAGRRLQPRLRAAEIVPATGKLLTPAPATFHANYHPTYAGAGFPATQGGGANAADLFLQVVDAAQVTQPTIPLPGTLPKVSFGSTERSGGFVDPAQQIAGLTRRLGTVGDLDGALSGTFDPAALLGQALPKLFGLFKLTDLLPALGLDQAPKFVTEALGPIQGLLADLAALQAAVQSAVAQAAELQAHADDLADAVDALTTALGTLLDPTQPHDPDTVGDQIETLLGAFTGTVNALVPLTATLPLSPLAKTELDKLLRGVQPYLADAAKIADAVDQVLAFVDGLDPENLEVRAKLEWTTPIEPFQIGGENVFEARDPLRIAIEARAGAKTGASIDAVAELTDFSLTLVPPASLMRMDFDRLAFRAGSSAKPDVDVVFGGIEFIGPLSFVETLKELIPLDGFSDPPFLDVSASGVRAGFTLGLPNVAVGVFALQNISLGADCNVPFLGESLSVGFNFCTRDRPFALTVTFIGGGGFLGVRVSPQGLELLELALEAGARLAVDLGVASGSIEAMLGIYLRLEGQGGSLAGYFRLRGEVDVLGLISASIELSLELVYEFDTGKMAGRATITIEVDVFMFSFSVSVTAERRFAGSNGDPTFAEVMELAADGSAPRWDDYCDAFA